MITVACACGKKFRTSDANAGKRTKCPGCGAVLLIPKPTAAAAAPAEVEADPDSLDSLAALAGGAEVFQPAAAGAAPKGSSSTRRAQRGEASQVVAPGAAAPSKRGGGRERAGGAITPNISVSPALVALIVCALVIPAVIYWAEHGPMEANRQWKQISGVASENIMGQVQRAIKHDYRDVLEDADGGGGMMMAHPKTGEAYFDEPAIMFRVPDTIRVHINSSEGMFNGDFHPKTWQFELSGKIAGQNHTLTGSASNEDQTLYMDGKRIN